MTLSRFMLRAAAAAGVFIRQNGAYGPVTGSIQVEEWIKSTVHYSPYIATGTWYPNRVKVIMDPGSAVRYPEFYLVPIVATGQQGFFAHGAQYSEGAVYLETAEGVKIGRGFLESTGYAQPNTQVLKLSGMPADDEMLELLNRPALSTEQTEACGAFLLEPANAARLEEELAQCKGL